MGAAKMMTRAVIGGARGVAEMHQGREGDERSLEAQIAQSPDPEATVNAINKLRRRRFLLRGIAGGLALALAAGIAYEGKQFFDRGVSVKPAVTEIQVGGAITGIKEDLRTPVVTVEGSQAVRITHAEHANIFGWQFNVWGSSDQTGIKVDAQDYTRKDPATGKLIRVHSGLDVMARAGAISLSGRMDPNAWWTDPNTHKRAHSPQIVATIDTSQFEGELANPRYEAPASINGNGDEPILWRVVYEGRKTAWATQAEDIADYEFDTNATASGVAPAGLPAGIAAQVKVWTRNEINALEGLGGSSTDIAILRQALAEPILLRFVDVSTVEQHPQAREPLVDPLSVGIAIPPLTTQEYGNLKDTTLIHGSELQTFAVGQQISTLEHQPNLFEIDGYPYWPN